MLVQQQIKNHIRDYYLPSAMRQIPTDRDLTHGMVTLHVKIDLIKTLRQATEIATFIIGNFIQFSLLVENSILEAMKEKHISVPIHGVNLSFAIHNCSLPRHNLESTQFLSSAFQQNSGILVFLKDCRVVMVDQPELYLSSWEEHWENACKCEGEGEIFKRRQRLVEIVKLKTYNLKEMVVKEVPRCSNCQAKMKFVKSENQIYMSCQKIKILSIMKSGNSKEEIFQKGQLQIFLDQHHVSTFGMGDNLDMCVYFSAEPYLAKISGENLGVQMRKSAYLVTPYQAVKRTSINSTFFSALTSLSNEYIHCPDPRIYETIGYNFSKLTQTVNQIKFPYLEPNSYSTMKLAILNSLLNQLHCNPLHLMFVTEEVSFIQRSVRLQGITIYQWPSQYDHGSLVAFLAMCHHAVVLVTNPGRKDLEAINGILNEGVVGNLNCTFWIIGEPHQEYRKDLNLDKIEIILDFSSLKNLNICRDMFDELIDFKLESFIDKNSQLVSTVQKKKKEDFSLDYQSSSFEGIEQSEHEIIEEAKVAEDLLQRYFLKAREYKHINTNALRTINKVASGFAYFRSFLRQKSSTPSKEPLPNVLDAILAIFIEEETSRHKYGSSNTLFSNQISKLLLNEEGCDIASWEYEIGEDNYMEESRRMIGKEQMLKNMVGKLTSLLYEGELY